MLGSQPVSVGVAGEAVARASTGHHVEGVAGLAAVGGRVGERADDLQHLDDRPGQPWVTTIGSASSCGDIAWMKWMSSPSISVTKLGTAFSRSSTRPQS